MEKFAKWADQFKDGREMIIPTNETTYTAEYLASACQY